MTRPVWLWAAILVLAAAASAQAEGYLGVYGGATLVPDQHIDFDGTSFSDIEFESTALYGGKAGFWPRRLPWLAAEFNVWSQRTGARDCPTDLTLVNFSGSLLLQHLWGPLRLYGGGGVLGTWAELDTWPRADDLAVGALAQVGLEAAFATHWALFAEYRYAVNHFDFQDDVDSFKVGLDRHDVLGGLSYRF
jgi:hypothetical protein